MTAQGILVPTHREYPHKKHRALDPKEGATDRPTHHPSHPNPIPNTGNLPSGGRWDVVCSGSESLRILPVHNSI